MRLVLGRGWGVNYYSVAVCGEPADSGRTIRVSGKPKVGGHCLGAEDQRELMQLPVLPTEPGTQGCCVRAACF